MIVETNKGNFKVRYGYEKEGVTILVILDQYGDYPFEGPHGDEIPMTNEMKAKYQANLKK